MSAVGQIQVSFTTASSSFPTIRVAGAGTSAANGDYLYFGMLSGKPSYVPSGGTDPTDIGIFWGGVSWIIAGTGGLSYYDTINGDVATPDLGTWESNDGDFPIPTVTHL